MPDEVLPEKTGLVCLSSVAARAYICGLEMAAMLLDEYDAWWGTDTTMHRDEIHHEAQTFRANWERTNNTKLGES